MAPSARSEADLSSALPDAVQALVAAHRDRPEMLLELLHAVQHELGHVPDGAVPEIAQALNLARAEVHGVVTYYRHFRRRAPGRHVIQVCRAEACRACGGEALLEHAERTLGCGRDRTSEEGRFTLEPVYCLGLCASSPAIQIDDRQHARVTPQRFDALVAALRGSALTGQDRDRRR